MKKFFSTAIAALAIAAGAVAQTPKYIFYFIGDGMGHGHVLSAATYKRLVQNDSLPLLMMQFPYAGMVTTYSANTPVTDSAAAGTALATGSKTRNNMLGMNADTVAVNSVAIDLAAAGYGIGLVTNVCPDDATPGAFYAHVPSRTHWYDIAMQFADSPVSFLAGSKLRGAMVKGQYTGLYEKLADKGVTIVRGVENLPAEHPSKLLLLNTDTISQNMGYTIDNPKGNNLGQFTEAAINYLNATYPERFFLMVEGGNIDWAGHDNDGPTIVREVLAYDNVLRQAYDFYLAHPDETLIIVTADHETGGLTVGQHSTSYNQFPQIVDRQHISKARFCDYCWNLLKEKTPVTWEEMQQKLATDLGFFDLTKLSEKQQKRLKDAFDRTFVTLDGEAYKNLYASYPEFALVAFEIQNEIAGYGFTSHTHTGNPVPLFAIGAGAEKFSGTLDNTDIPRILRQLTAKH